MRAHPKPVLKTIASVLFLTGLAPAFGQSGGSLVPPSGPPGPTMKSLDEVEPRIPVVNGAPGVSVDLNGTVTIDKPGSYYLTGNIIPLSNGSGILIRSSFVHLD